MTPHVSASIEHAASAGMTVIPAHAYLTAAAATSAGAPHAETLVYSAMILIGVLASAFFSGTETAIYQMSRLRLMVRERSGDRRAARLHREIAHPHRLLSALLIGNNGVNFMTSYGVTAILTTTLGFGDWGTIGVQAILLTPLLLVFGETLPKEMARAYADAVVYRVALLVSFVRIALTWTGPLPLVESLGRLVARLLGGAESTEVASSRARVVALMSEGIGHGVLTEGQSELVNRALLMRDRPVRRLMSPWTRVVSIPASLTIAEVRARMAALDHSQYPAVNDRGEVIGTVSILDLLLVRPGSERERLRVKDFLEQAVTLEPGASARHAVAALRREGASIAIVGALRRPVGLVTLTDLVEPLFDPVACGDA